MRGRRSHINDGVTLDRFYLTAVLTTGVRGSPLFDGEDPLLQPARRATRPAMATAHHEIETLGLVQHMKNAQIPGAYRAWANHHRPDLARFIREIFDLPCTDEQLARIEQALADREAVREHLFATTPPRAAEPVPAAASG